MVGVKTVTKKTDKLFVIPEIFEKLQNLFDNLKDDDIVKYEIRQGHDKIGEKYVKNNKLTFKININGEVD
jgi:hypothetical protein